MAIKKHTIDPEGDLLLILSRAPEAANTPSDTNSPASDPATFPSSLEEVEIKEPDTHLLVSSKHMAFASPVFKAMLGPNFKEGSALRSYGKVEISLDDDPVAFITLVNLIHGKHWSVPPIVNLEELVNLAILVDKYQVLEAAGRFSGSWVQYLYLERPKDYTEPGIVMDWLAIAWVFRSRGIFKDITKVIERKGGARIEEDVKERLPIPEPIIQELKSRRTQAISSVYTMIEQTIATYYQSGGVCPRSDDTYKENCDSMALGSLIIGISSAGIWPRPPAPYSDIDFGSINHSIREVTITGLCDTNIAQLHIGGYCTRGAHGVMEKIDAKLDAFERQFCGLDIKDFGREEKIIGQDIV